LITEVTMRKGFGLLSTVAAAALILLSGLASAAVAEPAEPGGAVGSYTILNTVDYFLDSYDRPQDAIWAAQNVADALGSHNWYNDYWYQDAAVTAGKYTSQVTGACKSDFFYSGSHGYGTGTTDPWYAGLALYWMDRTDKTWDQREFDIRDRYNGAVNGAVQNVASSYPSRWYGDDSTTSKDLEYGWLWACSSLKLSTLNKSGWCHAFDKGLNLLLGYRDDIPSALSDDAIQPVMDRMFGESPNDRAYTVWTSFIWGSQEIGLTQWAIDGYVGHKLDWVQGATVPPGYINDRDTEYYTDSNVLQWNQGNYSGSGTNIYTTSLHLGASDIWPSDAASAPPSSFLLANATSALEPGNVRVSCALSDEGQTVGSYSLQPETGDLASVASKVLAASAKEKKGEGVVAYCDAQCDLVRREQSGLVTLSREIAGLSTPTEMSYEDAVVKAEDFIGKAGGIPENYRLVNCSTIDQGSALTGTKSSLAWTFKLEPTVDGIAIDSPGGMFIIITVSDDGVYFYRRWTPLLVKDAMSHTTLSAKDALQKASSYLPAAFFRDSVDIESVDLVYFAPTVGDYEKMGITALRPAFKVTASGCGVPVYLDALDATVLSGLD
jgi:hypothetical protein